MENIDRLKIYQNIDLLARSIDMETLWPKLIDHRIFHHDYPEISRWKDNLNNLEVIKNILLEIRTRGPHAFQNLIHSLEETDQHNCVQILSASNRLAYDPLNADRPLKIEVRKSTSFCDEFNNPGPIEIYPMKSKPRGIVLIMLLYSIHNNAISKKSIEYDEKNLIDLFKQMGFIVYVEKNLDTTEIIQKAKEFSKQNKLRYVDCAFFIVVGNNVEDINNVSMSLKNTSERENSTSDDKIAYGQLIHYFNGQNCPILVNKPKVFIFHRGNSINVNNSLLRIEEDDNVNYESNLQRTDTRIKPRNYSDMLISSSTIHDNTFGMTKYGSLFIQVLCEVFMKYAHNTHVNDLFKIVNARLKSLVANDNRNVPSFVIKNIGFNRCFINPGMFEDDI